MSSAKEIKAIFSEFLKTPNISLDQFKAVVNRTKQDADKFIKSVNTRMQMYSSIRTMVKEQYGIDGEEYKYLKTLVVSDRDRRERKEKADERVMKANTNQTVLPKAKLFEFMKHLMSGTPDIKDRAIMLQLASGSRLIEILHSDFKYTQSTIGSNIIQNNVAKNSKEQYRSVDKPIIFMKPSVFISELALLRKELDQRVDDTYHSLGQRYTSVINNRIVETGKIVGAQIKTSHDLRRIYACLSYELMGVNNKNMSQQAWIRSVLGHSDFTSTANYCTFQLV